MALSAEPGQCHAVMKRGKRTLKIYILTDLEGPAGVERFSQVRGSDEVAKREAMTLLTEEVNACIQGIHDVSLDADIQVWDGHGHGGLLKENLLPCTYLPQGRASFHAIDGSSALLFVGQHAMAGTYNATLNHTYNSRKISYYKLNGFFLGEFGARALVAGYKGVPTVFLSGDDKAVAEAKMFIPDIETVITKVGTGHESAIHESPEWCRQQIRERSAYAVSNLDKYQPFTGFQPPFEFEMGHYEAIDPAVWKNHHGHITFPDSRTVRIVTDDLSVLPF